MPQNQFIDVVVVVGCGSSGNSKVNVVLGVPSSSWSTLLLRGKRNSRRGCCALDAGDGRLCDHAPQVPADLSVQERVGASDSVYRHWWFASASSCATETSTHSANCATTGDSTVQFLVRLTCLSSCSDWCRWSRQCSSLDGFSAGSIFWEPSMTHSCELSRARGVPLSPGVLLPGDSAPGLCQSAVVTCSGNTLVSSLTSVRNNNNKQSGEAPFSQARSLHPTLGS